MKKNFIHNAYIYFRNGNFIRRLCVERLIYLGGGVFLLGGEKYLFSRIVKLSGTYGEVLHNLVL